MQAPDAQHINYLPEENSVKYTPPSIQLQVHTMNVLVSTQILTEWITFLYVSIGYSAISTIRNTVQNNKLALFPSNLTSSQIGKNLHFSVQSQLCHTTQEYQSTQSTKVFHIPLDKISTPDVEKITALDNTKPRHIIRKANNVFAKCFQLFVKYMVILLAVF